MVRYALACRVSDSLATDEHDPNLSTLCVSKANVNFGADKLKHIGHV
jgi:hypothetical protein